MRHVIAALKGANKRVVLAMLLPIAVAVLLSYQVVAEAQEEQVAQELLARAMGAGLAVGLAGIGGGIAVGMTGAAAISAVTERRELLGLTLLYVVLGEGIAIYGLLIALLVLFAL